ncbi:MAG TPA: hypothetical protein VKT49_26105 [Bryobacteraceae bacterium]|nr:hypothetical protein [Bryobacteraceae bacterium]
MVWNRSAGSGALGAALAVLIVLQPAHGQSAKAYTPPRLADGHPDLQGTYDLGTLTPLERPAGARPVLTREEAEKLQGAVAVRRERANAPSRPDRPAPPKGGDGSTGAAGGTGGYNNFWLDPGSTFNIVDGQIRTSLIVDPADGRIPAYTAAARRRIAALQGRPTSDAQENRPPGADLPGSFDDPERRPLGERCLLGFGSTSGPPALPDYFYNNLHQIVQTPDSIMISSEMVHDVRIVRMNAQHLPPAIRRWMGDSIGRWEGDTLVVDTINFTDKTRFRGSTQNLHVVERFSRLDDQTLLYRFTIDDPDTWDRPWSGEYAWPATDKPIYEYACHEGNYALGDILRGARALEAEEGASGTSPR